MIKNIVQACALTVFFAIVSDRALAQESAHDADPIESDAETLKTPSSAAFQLEKEVDPGPWSLKESMQDLPAFFKDTTLKLNVRNFYFNRQDGADAPGNDKERISYALGGSAQLKTGKLFDVFSVWNEFFTSQNLYGPKDKDGALLLEPGQEGYSVIGVANPRFDYNGHLVSLYRQRMDLPYVNSQDNRMTPNTFEGYSYAYLGEGEAPPYQFGIGYIDRIKKRNTEDFVSMSEGAGVVDSERGMPWLGFRLRPTDNLKIAAVNFAGLDFLNMFYSDAEYSHKLSDEWGLKSSVQFSEQRSLGDDLLTGSDVSVAMFGVQQAISYNKIMFRTAVTANDKGDTLRSPFGSYPGYNSGITEDFNRAGEVAWKVGLSYDFAALGLEGVTAYTDYILGNRAVDADKEPLPDKEEIDINIDYRVKEGLLSGFWLRVRSGFIHEDGVGTTKDFRVILNHELPLL